MKIVSAEFLCHNVKATAEFYNQSLGLPIHMIDETTVVFGCGESRLIFRLRQDETKCRYHFAFNVPSGILEDAIQYHEQHAEIIRQNGEAMVDFKAWNAHSFYFFDNNGNILEMISRHDLEDKEQPPYKPGMIRCISEVAVVVEDVKKFCRDFTEKTGVTYYEKQPPQPNFAALGNAHGLIIVSEKGRNWFPTEIVSESAPLQVKILPGDQMVTLNFN